VTLVPAVPATSPIVTLTRYKAWADDVLYATLATVPEAALAEPTPIFAGSILRTLNHVYVIDVVWKSHLLGVPHGLATRNPATFPPFAELRQAQAAMDAWYIQQAETMTPAQGDEVVKFAFIGGGAGAMRRADILLHGVNHATYHRGHISAMMRLAGLRSPATDLPVFTRDAVPASSTAAASG
jgi:uncharacterized damage-inducible protein DinB